MAPAGVPGGEVPIGDIALETGAGFIQVLPPISLRPQSPREGAAY